MNEVKLINSLKPHYNTY